MGQYLVRNVTKDQMTESMEEGTYMGVQNQKKSKENEAYVKKVLVWKNYFTMAAVIGKLF